MAIAKHISESDLIGLKQSSFWSFADQSSASDCWPWTGSANDKGYGRFRHGDTEFRAHRVAFALGKNTALPGVVFVCHRCDNPSCVNPNHLFIGLPVDNTLDARAKGRAITPRSTANGNGKLTDEQAAAIASSKDKGAALALQYGVSQALISMIRSGKRRMVGDASFELATFRV